MRLILLERYVQFDIIAEGRIMEKGCIDDLCIGR